MKLVTDSLIIMLQAIGIMINLFFVASVYLILMAAWLVAIQWAWGVVVETLT